MPVWLIVRRVKPTLGSQLALFASYSYHGFITDRDGETLELEADYRRHAEIENAIRDLKYGVGLNHLPSGRFAANAAWLAIQVMAYNLARWTARIGLGEQLVTTKTLRRRFFSIAGRLTHAARPHVFRQDRVAAVVPQVAQLPQQHHAVFQPISQPPVNVLGVGIQLRPSSGSRLGPYRLR